MLINIIVYYVINIFLKIIISKEHLNNFENNISIKIKDSIKKKFVDLIFDFHIIDKNMFYKD